MDTNEIASRVSACTGLSKAQALKAFDSLLLCAADAVVSRDKAAWHKLDYAMLIHSLWPEGERDRHDTAPLSGADVLDETSLSQVERDALAGFCRELSDLGDEVRLTAEKVERLFGPPASRKPGSETTPS